MLNKIKEYFRESFEELTKVTWPTQNQAIVLTGVVMVFILVVAVLLGLTDLGLNKLQEFALSLRG